MMKKNIYLALIVSLSIVSCGKKFDETKPIRKDVIENVFATGVLEPEDKYNLCAQTEGYIVSMNIEEGDIVSTGDLLALIDNKQNIFQLENSQQVFEIAQQNISSNGPSLTQAKNNMLLAKEKLVLDSIQFGRYEKLFLENSVSRLEFDNIQFQYSQSKINYKTSIENYKLVKQQVDQLYSNSKAQQQINAFFSANNQLKSISNGKVYKMYKEKGDYVKKGDVIATIGHATQLFAKVSIDESNIDKISINQKAVIQLNTNTNKSYHAVVSKVYPTFDENTQSFYCKLTFTDSIDFVINGTQLQANIMIKEQKNALVIPKKYLSYDNSVTTKDREKIFIKTGFISNEWVEVLSGIDEYITIIAEQGTVGGTQLSPVN